MDQVDEHYTNQTVVVGLNGYVSKWRIRVTTIYISTIATSLYIQTKIETSFRGYNLFVFYRKKEKNE